MPPRSSIKLTENHNVLGSEIRRLRLEAGIKQREMVAKLQSAGWDLSFDTLCQIEQGNRTLTDVELFLILRLLKKQWEDVRPPRVKFLELDKKRK